MEKLQHIGTEQPVAKYSIKEENQGRNEKFSETSDTVKELSVYWRVQNQ